MSMSMLSRKLRAHFLDRKAEIVFGHHVLADPGKHGRAGLGGSAVLLSQGRNARRKRRDPGKAGSHHQRGQRLSGPRAGAAENLARHIKVP
jgi:hypothetical protein